MSEPLFDHDEYMERMEYYYATFIAEGSPYLAAKSLNVDISLIWEAIELQKQGAFNG